MRKCKLHDADTYPRQARIIIFDISFPDMSSPCPRAPSHSLTPRATFDAYALWHQTWWDHHASRASLPDAEPRTTLSSQLATEAR